MDIIQGPAIRRVPDVHPPRPVLVPAVTMVRVAVMAVVQTLGRAVRRLRHVHVQLKPRHVIHLVHLSQAAAAHHQVRRVVHMTVRRLSPMRHLQHILGHVHIQTHVMGIIPTMHVRRRVHHVRDVRRGREQLLGRAAVVRVH